MSKKNMKKMRINGAKVNVKLPEGVSSGDLPKTFKADPDVKIRSDVKKILEKAISF